MTPEIKQRLDAAIESVYVRLTETELSPTVFEADFAPRFWRPAGFKVLVQATYRSEAIRLLREQGYPIARITAIRHKRGVEWVEHSPIGIRADIAEILD